MKFSLKAVFAILTIACLFALVFQQRQAWVRLGELKSNLGQELAGISPHLESDLEFLRIAAAPNKSFEALYLEATTSGWNADEAFTKRALETPNQVSVTHLPTKDRTHKKFSVYVPESKVVALQIFVSSDLFKGEIETAKTDSPFKLDKNFDALLPSGFSTLSLLPAKEAEEEVWQFVLNGTAICTGRSEASGLNGQNMIWLMSNHQNVIGSFRHYNTHDRVRHVCAVDDVEIEFASFVSSDYMKAVIAGIPPKVSKLKCSLVIGSESVREK